MPPPGASVNGILELQNKGTAFLRRNEGNYAPTPKDCRVDVRLIRAHGLRGGEIIVGSSGGKSKRGPAELTKIESINGMSPEDYFDIKPLPDLTAVDPREPIKFESPEGPLSMRVVDLLTPIGRGQRGLIVAAPRTGKTVLLQQLAAGVAANHPDMQIIVLLVDERPEEVTEMRRNIKGEVAASSNDRDAASHMRIARLVIDKASRQAECGKDVFLLIDSLTRLGRASNTMSGGGRIMSGGLGHQALTVPKAMFGAARNIESGGSLTIIATVLVDTGSRMDEVIFNEFKGTGNMEIMLSRVLANRRVWPAIDLQASGTRKEELLLSEPALELAHRLRRKMSDKSTERDMEELLALMKKYPSNEVMTEKEAQPVLRTQRRPRLL